VASKAAYDLTEYEIEILVDIGEKEEKVVAFIATKRI
jgi:hypothetical protein